MEINAFLEHKTEDTPNITLVKNHTAICFYYLQIAMQYG